MRTPEKTFTIPSDFADTVRRFRESKRKRQVGHARACGDWRENQEIVKTERERRRDELLGCAQRLLEWGNAFRASDEVHLLWQNCSNDMGTPGPLIPLVVHAYLQLEGPYPRRGLLKGEILVDANPYARDRFMTYREWFDGHLMQPGHVLLSRDAFYQHVDPEVLARTAHQIATGGVWGLPIAAVRLLITNLQDG
jgi:hypothetical protein